MNPPRCLYCGSADTRPWARGIRDRLGWAPGEWSYDRCAECGSAMLRPLPADLAACYPPVYTFAVCSDEASWLRKWLSRLEYACFYRPMYRHDVRRVVARVGGRATPARRLLDVGCGRGLRLAEFRRAGFEVQAVDAQPEVVDYVRRELGVPAVCADVEQLDGAFEPESFDVIAAFYILEHVKDVAGTLRRCFNVLRPGGWLAATVPLVDSLQAACFGGCWSAATEAPRHVSLPSRAGLRQLCQAGGWTDVTLEAHSLWNCAGSLALSLVPRSNTSALYGDRRFAALFWRLLGAAVLLAATPWCAAENYIFLRPATGLLLARKPDGQTHVG